MTAPFTITAERPDSTDAAELVSELESHLAERYAIESRHGLSVERLISEGVAFFVLREGGRAAGCGGIKVIGNEFGELKRMYVRPAFRGRGFGRRLVEHLEAHARQCHLPLLRLETGVQQQEAIALYERMGFVQIPPFPPYRFDPVSRCYEKRLE